MQLQIPQKCILKKGLLNTHATETTFPILFNGAIIASAAAKAARKEPLDVTLPSDASSREGDNTFVKCVIVCILVA